MAELQNDVISALQSEVAAQTQGLIGDSSSAQLDTYIENRIRNSVTTNNIQTCIQESRQRQSILVERASATIIEDVSMKQTLEAFQKCVGSNESVTQAAADISNTIESITSATTENTVGSIITDIVDSITSIFTMPMMIVALFIILLILYVIYAFLAGDSSEKPIEIMEVM
jgi:hypothetical protein